MNSAVVLQPKKTAPGLFVALAAATLLPLFAVAAGQDAPLPKVVFLPHWIPQAQFAGPYMAAEKGLYRQHGLEVVILDGGPRKPADKSLVSGEATFASHFLSSALKLRDEGIPLVHLAQITQRSALMLVAHKSHGIQSVQDLDGKKVSLWRDFSVQPRALFRKYNLRVKTITQGPTMNLFMRGGVDAASAMWYNEYHLILNCGLNEDEVTLFFYDQHGLNFPEDCIVCLAETWQTKPELCRKFVQATLEGWQYVLSHPDESLRVVMQRAGKARTGTNRSHQRWMLDRMRDLIQPVKPATAMGELSRDAYERVVGQLKASGEIKVAPGFEEFHVPLRP
jgi:NitT/TauT family transport system substrate-binding protein